MTIEWKLRTNEVTLQPTINLYVDEKKHSQVCYTFGPSDFDDIAEIVTIAYLEIKEECKDLTPVDLMAANVSLYNLLNKIKDTYVRTE